MTQPFKLVCLLAWSFLSITASAQTAPKVVFTGDQFTLDWQVTPQFTANHNWIGAGVHIYALNPGTSTVEQDFQTNVINQHPAFVHIITGAADIADITDSSPLGVVWHEYQEALVQMVGMAQKANIKVILGNIPGNPGVVNPYPQGTQLFNAWLADYGIANHIPVVNYHDALCQCVGSTSPNDTYASSLSAYPPPDPNNSTPNDAGYALITQMAQTAIQTYGLTIKSGYLNNVLTVPAFEDDGRPTTNTNDVYEGEVLVFTPQAKWSDGVVRPMLNQDFNGLKGIWTSSNPAVMYVNQQGQAFAYSAGKATISFRSASGVTFSPWIMTVEEIYPGSI
jgi:hypothetical protein